MPVAVLKTAVLNDRSIYPGLQEWNFIYMETNLHPCILKKQHQNEHILKGVHKVLK